jgi:predicted acylesterase/phospholipase RssA
MTSSSSLRRLLRAILPSSPGRRLIIGRSRTARHSSSSSHRVARKPDLGTLPGPQRRAAKPRQLLALSGGGFRGLFTAKVLELLEIDAGPIGQRFDVIGGTSIGGILAIALACGISAASVRQRFAEDGRKIFRKRILRAGGLIGARYSPDPLRKTIAAALGAWVSRPFADIPKPLLVVAIEERSGQPKIFRSNALAPGQGDSVTILDAALATSAAPTFFPPHHIGKAAYVDGGLIANSPDLVLVSEAMRRFGSGLSDLAVLSVGTAGSPREGRAGGDPGAAAWLLSHRLIELTIDAQASLAMAQLKQLGPRRVLRIDAAPERPMDMDDASARAIRSLEALGVEAIGRVKGKDLAELRRLLAHTA